MIPETFTKQNSVIHRLDPRIRIGAAILFSFVVALCDQLPALYPALAAAVVLVAAARLSVAGLARRLIVPLFFLAFLWIMVPLTFPGQAMGQVFGLTVSRPGINLCVQITMKLLSIFLALTALISTMNPNDMAHALERMGFPRKIIVLLFLTLRYLLVFLEEFHRLKRSAKIRCFSPATDFHTYRTYADMLAMVLVRAADRADRVQWAMRCRGFRGRFYSLASFSVTSGDIIFALVSACVISGLIWIQWRP